MEVGRYRQVAAVFPLAAAFIAMLCLPAAAGVLDTVNSVYTGATSGFEAKAAWLSQHIFYTAVALDVCWTGYECTHAGADIFDILKRGCVGWALGAILVGQQTVIVDAVTSTIASMQGSFAGSATPISPDTIAGMGFDAAGKLGVALKIGNPAVAFLLALPIFVSALIIQITYVIVAAEDLVINDGLQLAIICGSMLLGFAATRWTRWIAGMWAKMVVSGLLLYIALGIVIALGTPVTKSIIVLIGLLNGSDPASALQDLAAIDTASVVYFVFSIGLTGLAAFMGAQTPASVATVMVSSAMTALSYATGYRAGSGGGSHGAGSGGEAKDPVAQIEAATQAA